MNPGHEKGVFSVAPSGGGCSAHGQAAEPRVSGKALDNQPGSTKTGFKEGKEQRRPRQAPLSHGSQHSAASQLAGRT